MLLGTLEGACSELGRGCNCHWKPVGKILF